MTRAVVPLTGALLVGMAVAQEPQVPFLEHPTELRHAYALDLVGLHLDTIELGVPEKDDAEEGAEAVGGEGEEEAGLLEVALPLMAGSLADQDEALIGRLETSLAATETGDAAAEEVRDLITEIEGVLIPEALGRDVTFRAARLALLASLEPGVGEGYEEAAQGEIEAYYIGYTGLGRVKEMWTELGLELDGDKANIERAFGVLDALMPSPELPERFSDPEDAEVAVNDIIFGLEALTGTALIPRDFALVLDAVDTHVAEGCGAAEARNTRLALEWTTAAGFFYDAYLTDTVGMLAPEADGRIGEALGELVEEPVSEGTARRCRTLSDAFGEARGVFGG